MTSPSTFFRFAKDTKCARAWGKLLRDWLTGSDDIQSAVEPQSTCHKRVRMSACHVSVANVGLSATTVSRRAAYVDDVR